MLFATTARGHVVTQIFGEWKNDDPWEIEVLFDAGYAVPEWRGDGATAAPTRDWLLKLGEPGWAPLRLESERYLRECLTLTSGGKPVTWRVEFIDFAKSPPDFPELLNDGAYFRMRLTSSFLEMPDKMSWSVGGRPSLVLKLPGQESGYLTLAPGQSLPFPRPPESVASPAPVTGRASWIEAFQQGFAHVLPKGLDHLLFVLGLFFYRRRWRPLISQSLAFTLAHTVTLGLAAAGWVRVSASWVEPLIALSLVAVALENLRPAGNRNTILRHAIVFSFGLIHGLGFAGSLSVWLKPGDGFFIALFSANLGVEAAQAVIIVLAWIATLPLYRTPYYPRLRVGACLSIAALGLFWAIQRL
ncbi:hypothetical protein GCM10023212_22310 [Luteolibacter yonseiensis]